MEENGRVTVKKVERPDGMTEYLLEYIPPIKISEGNYLKEEHLNLAMILNGISMKPSRSLSRRFAASGISNPSRRISLSSR